jgi:hypothetical protein
VIEPILTPVLGPWYDHQPMPELPYRTRIGVTELLLQKVELFLF